MTNKQQAFIAEYLKDFNATQAAKRAGYSDDTAYSQGQRLLKNGEVRKSITLHVDSILGVNKTALEARIVDELMAIAFADITADAQIVTKTTKDKDGDDIEYQTVEFSNTEDSQQGRAVSSMKVSDKGHLELKYYDKQRALELLGKYMTMFTERVEHGGNVSVIVPDALMDK